MAASVAVSRASRRGWGVVGLLVSLPAVAVESAGAQVLEAGVIQAQGQPSARDSVYVVRAGDTLWALAERFLGSGHAWRIIAERNRISTATDRPLIRVGQKLDIPPRPAAGAPGGSPAADQPAPPAAVVAPAGPPAVEQAPAGAAGDRPVQPASRRIGLVTDADRVAARSAREPATVFHRDLPSLDTMQLMTRMAVRRSEPVPRLAEFESAPLVVSEQQFAASTRLVGHATSPQRGALHVGDPVELASPAAGMAVGMRFAIGGTPVALGKTGLVVLPVGVLRITRVAPNAPVIGEVVRQTGPILGGMRLLPIRGEPSNPRRAVPIDRSDLEASVLWVDDEARTPTLQDYLLLGTGTTGGVRAGDEFVVFATTAGLETETVRVRVVRADAATSVAIIVWQTAAGVKRGMMARRVARAP